MSANWMAVLRRLNLNHLTAFSAVVDCGSFRAAASRLHISQSALSVQIRQLEDAVGVQLLQRNTRSVSLTSEGARLCEVFERSGVELARVVTQLKDEGRLEAGAILIAVLPSLAATYMSALLPVFQALYPGITVRMRDIDSRRAYEQVGQGAVDLGVLSRSPRAADIPFLPLFQEELVAVIPANHAELGSYDVAGIKDLARYPMLLNPHGVDLRDQLEEIFQHEGVTVEAAQELTGTSSLVALVSSGMGVTVLPRSSLHGLDLRRCRLLAFRPLSFRTIGVASPPGRTLSPAAAAFRDFMTTHAATVSLIGLTDASVTGMAVVEPHLQSRQQAEP
ncbi:MAG: LysR family transcriptional regulator [Burkholderiaceae bacterium]